MKILITALALMAVGVLLTVAAMARLPWDFAVAVKPGWHVTVFPPPLWAGLLLILGGLIGLVVYFQTR